MSGVTIYPLKIYANRKKVAKATFFTYILNYLL